jgi:hypothetical protein
MGYSSPPLPSSPPLEFDTPTPAPDATEDEPLGASDSSTAALVESRDGSILDNLDTDALQLLSTAGLDGPSSPWSAEADNGWSSGPQDANPYSGVVGGDGMSDPFVGQDVNPYSGTAADASSTNAFTGGQSVNPFDGSAHETNLADAFQQALTLGGPIYGAGSGSMDTSQMWASNGSVSAGNTALPDTSQLAAPAAQPSGNANAPAPEQASDVVPELAGSPKWTLEQLNQLLAAGEPMDKELANNGGAAPQDQTPPAAPQPPAAATAAPPSPPAAMTFQPPQPLPPASEPPAPRSDFWDTLLGDMLSGIAGLFGPAAVGPYLHPQSPANLPTGLQQMGQLNAQMARQSMMAAGVITRRTMLVAGAPYAATTLGLAATVAAPTVSAAYTEAGIQASVRFRAATETALTVVDALSETAIPRAALAAGGTVVAAGGGAAAMRGGLGTLAQARTILGPQVKSTLQAAGRAAQSGGGRWQTPEVRDLLRQAEAAGLRVSASGPTKWTPQQIEAAIEYRRTFLRTYKQTGNYRQAASVAGQAAHDVIGAAARGADRSFFGLVAELKTRLGLPTVEGFQQALAQAERYDPTKPAVALVLDMINGVKYFIQRL